MKDCPMCGETMRLVVHNAADSIPGQGQVATREIREWMCPECDYFEEAEAEEG
jgi:C4-type Zn-finger protein